MHPVSNLDNVAVFVACVVVLEAGVARGDGLESVVKVLDNLVERQPVLEYHAAPLQKAHVHLPMTGPMLLFLSLIKQQDLCRTILRGMHTTAVFHHAPARRGALGTTR